MYALIAAAAALARVASAAPVASPNNALVPRAPACGCGSGDHVIRDLRERIDRIVVDLRAKVDVNVLGLVDLRVVLFLKAIVEIEALIRVAVSDLGLLIGAGLSIDVEAFVQLVVELLVSIFAFIKLAVDLDILHLIVLRVDLRATILVALQLLIKVILELAARVFVGVDLLALIVVRLRARLDIIAFIRASIHLDIVVGICGLLRLVL